MQSLVQRLGNKTLSTLNIGKDNFLQVLTNLEFLTSFNKLGI